MNKITNESFQTIESAAHTGAFGNNQLPTPTDRQTIAGNYKLGRVAIYGIPIAIEQPRHSYRTGLDPKTGKRWTSRLAAHYGYFSGTKGADNDPIDCFVGFYPQSDYAYVINQFVAGQWDEHKVMLCFPDEDSARLAYSQSYDRGWKGLHSLTTVSINQLKWWLKNGNHKKPLLPNHLPAEGFETMNKRVAWDNTQNPYDMTLDKLLYEIRRADAGENLIFDAVSMADILEDVESIMILDALVTPYAKLQRKMDVLKVVMERTGGDIKPVALQISEPFKSGGVLQVAVIFELSDGQTVSVFFHNPDVDPKKIQPGDELISWKWLLNKKDITVIAAPERGLDLNVKTVAERIMKLAVKNSPAFIRANANRAEKLAVIEALKVEIPVLEKELADAQHELEVAKVESESKVVTDPVLSESKNKVTLEWSEASDVENKDFSTLNELQQYMREEYENDPANLPGSGYDKHRFTILGTKSIRIDVGINKGDFNPFNGNLSKYLIADSYDVDVEADLPSIGNTDPEPIIKPIVNYSVNAQFASEDANPAFGYNQTCHVEWKNGKDTRYGAFVGASDADKREFGLGIFRSGKGEFAQEVIAKIDPKGMKIFFIDNQFYLDEDEVKWEAPVKLTKLIIFNKPLFEEAFIPLPAEEAKVLPSMGEAIIAIVDSIGGMIRDLGREYTRTVEQNDLSRRQIGVQPANDSEIWVGTKIFAATGNGRGEFVDQKYFGLDQVDAAIEFGKELLTWVNGDNEPKPIAEKHYSDQVLDELVANYGWNHGSEGFVSKNIGGNATGGSLNPEGDKIVNGTFDEKGRYLSLQSGMDTIFDIDCRDISTQDAAKEFNDKVNEWKTQGDNEQTNQQDTYLVIVDGKSILVDKGSEAYKRGFSDAELGYMNSQRKNAKAVDYGNYNEGYAAGKAQNEQTNEQTEVETETEAAGTEGGDLAIIDSKLTDAKGAIYRDKIAEAIKQTYGDNPKIIVISKDEDGNVLSIKKTNDAGVKRAMSAARNSGVNGSVNAISPNTGEKYLKALGHEISSEISVKLPSWINKDGVYMLDRGYLTGVSEGDYYRGLKFTGLTNMQFNFSSEHTGYGINFNDINGLIEKGLLKLSDGKEAVQEIAATYVNSKGSLICTVTKTTDSKGSETYDIKGDTFSYGADDMPSLIKKLKMLQLDYKSMKLGSGTDFLNLKNDTQLTGDKKPLFYDPSESWSDTEAAVNLLQAIVRGAHDNADLVDLLDMLDKSATVLIDAGITEDQDALVGLAAEKYAALDFLKYGN